MSKALVIAILFGFCSPQVFGFFSQFVVVTPDLEGHEEFQPWLYQDWKDQDFVTVIFPYHAGDLAYWLIHANLPLSDEELNFRPYVWQPSLALPKKLSSITRLSNESGTDPKFENFLKLRIRKSDLANYYVYYDFVSPVDGGGFFRAFRLSSYPIGKSYDLRRELQMEAFCLQVKGLKKEAREKLLEVEKSLTNPQLKKEFDDLESKANKLVPSKLINLRCWKLQLPEDTERVGNPDEVKSPELELFSHSQFFFLDEAQKAVTFRAPCGGATTKNSKYPRSELREMTEDGKERATWSTARDDRHVFSAELAITKLPHEKPHVVCAQVHDSKSDLLAIRLEKKHLFIYRDDYPKLTLDAGYKLGRPFSLKISSGKGRIIVSYEGTEVLNWQINQPQCYYKVGCYTQSNIERGDDALDYGETRLYELDLRTLD